MHNLSNNVVSICVHSQTEESCGAGIVVQQKPLIIMVPSHLATAIELGTAAFVTLNNIPVNLPLIISSPALLHDEIILLKFKAVPQKITVHPIKLPKRRQNLALHDKVTVLSPSLATAQETEIIKIYEKAGEKSIVTDLSVEPGVSGSAILYEGKLVAVCQGMTAEHRAIAIPLSDAALQSLAARTKRQKRALISISLVSLIPVLVLFVVSGYNPFSHFGIGEVKLDNSNKSIVIYSKQSFPFSPTYRHSYLSPITSTAIAKDGEGHQYIVVGTAYSEQKNGEVSLLNSKGHELWYYKIPPEACVYNTSSRIFTDFTVVKVAAYDLNNDSQDEIIVAVQGHHWYPSALITLDLKGNVIGQYWNPGYILDFVVGYVGNSKNPIIVITAINNDLYARHCKVVFALDGTNIAGEAPPHLGRDGRGTALWYKVIPDLPQGTGTAIAELDILDENGDGKNDILVKTKDGRFYYLNESGNLLSVGVADGYTSSDIPPLITIAP